jgi:uncharacterized protein (TIGR00251 family)
VIELIAHREGVILPVRAQPGARSTSIRGEQNGAIKVAVTQVAEQGKANKALIEVLAKRLGLRKSQLELIAGETSADKRFLVRDVTLSELAAAVAAAVNNSSEP